MSVLIVGAGISGLSCGYHLNALAANVFLNIDLDLDIVDARDDVGGRIQKLTDAPFITEAGLDLDMGGQDLFFGDQTQYANLLTLEDQDKFRAFRDDFPTVRYGSLECEDAYEDEGTDCNRKERRTSCDVTRRTHYCICEGTSPGPDVAIDGTVCNVDESTLEAIANTNGGTCEEWCAQYSPASSTACDNFDDPYSCADAPFPRNSIRNASFADASLGTWVKEFFYEPIKGSVTLETEITRINYRGIRRGRKIRAFTADGDRILADHLVLAVPITTLKQGKIQFIPPLPVSYREKIEEAQFSTGVRIWIEFEENFYDDATSFPGNRPNETRYWDAVKGYNTDKNIVTVQGNRNEFSGTLNCVEAYENEGTDCGRKETPTSCDVTRTMHYCTCEGVTPSKNFDIDGTVCEFDDEILSAIANTNGGTCEEWCAQYSRTGNKALTDMSDEELRDLLINDLDAAYNGQASENYDRRADKFYVRNYAKEPFIEMTTSGENTDLETLNGRIWFVGDYRSGFSDNPSAESGKLAAQKIIESLIVGT